MFASSPNAYGSDAPTAKMIEAMLSSLRITAFDGRLMDSESAIGFYRVPMAAKMLDHRFSLLI